MEEILQPRTDGGVLAQGAIIALVFALGFIRVRHDRDWRLLLAGLAVFTLGLFALRATH
ncbi:MAG: hypothetical protein KY462_02305 [Actinobacteria bacterium]|nr:hypothetical protein [Actinomycetota bacterium]